MLNFFCYFIFFAKIKPPLPVVIVLFPLKLIIPISPNVPTCLSLYFVPTASVASSISNILYFLQIFKISFILLGNP